VTLRRCRLLRRSPHAEGFEIEDYENGVDSLPHRLDLSGVSGTLDAKEVQEVAVLQVETPVV
jgi:hypothetical protein